MQLPSTLQSQLIEKLVFFEGSIPWPYLDTRGNVTVGVGAMIPDAARFASLPFAHDSTHTPAEDAEKSAAWSALKAHGFGPSVGAPSFRAVTDLRLDDDAVRGLLSEHIEQVHGQLAGFYARARGFSTDFDDFAPSLQLALFDMAFNLGFTKLTTSYPTFNDALRRGDWATAAAQSHRNGIPEGRNAYVLGLLQSLH